MIVSSDQRRHSQSKKGIYRVNTISKGKGRSGNRCSSLTSHDVFNQLSTGSTEQQKTDFWGKLFTKV